MGLANILRRAQENPQRIVLPEGDEPRTVSAAAEMVRQGVARPILLGEPDAVLAVAKDSGANLEGVEIVNPKTAPCRKRYAERLFERRKAKGMTEEQAWDLSGDPMYFGVLMVDAGDADGEVSGAVHSTADTLRPALQILGTAPGIKLVSSAMLMVIPKAEYGEEGTIMFADCGLVTNPNPEELASIAITTAVTTRALLGFEPRVAMLSYSTVGSGKGPDVDKVREATAIARRMAPDLALDGELQADAALVPWVGKKKAPGSPVAGKANVLIFPDLSSGNIGYKLVERLAGAQAIGPILQGISKPVNDLSRGCSSSDIVNVAAITGLQAGATDKSREAAG